MWARRRRRPVQRLVPASFVGNRLDDHRRIVLSADDERLAMVPDRRVGESSRVLDGEGRP